MAITYSEFKMALHADTERNLVTLLFCELATAAAGTETVSYAPSPSNMAQVFARLRDKNYRIKSWVIEGQVLSKPIRVVPYWYPGPNPYVPVGLSSVVLQDNEQTELMRDSAMFDGSQIMQFDGPDLLGYLGYLDYITALTIGDAIWSGVVLEVEE